MDRICSCGNHINHLHGNAVTCITCKNKVKRNKIKRMEEMILIPVSDFKQLKRDSDISKGLRMASILHHPICLKEGVWYLRYENSTIKVEEWYADKVERGEV